MGKLSFKQRSSQLTLILSIIITFALMLASCSTVKEGVTLTVEETQALTKSVTVKQAQLLIRNGKVFLIAKVSNGCNFIVLRNEEKFCVEPKNYDLHAWVKKNNLSHLIEGVVIISNH